MMVVLMPDHHQADPAAQLALARNLPLPCMQAFRLLTQLTTMAQGKLELHLAASWAAPGPAAADLPNRSLDSDVWPPAVSL